MNPQKLSSSILALCLGLAAATTSAQARFLDEFDGKIIVKDSEGLRGWAFFTGDGTASMDFVASGDGHAVMSVDGTTDRRNIWWALIKRCVSNDLDLAQLAIPGREMRVEARVRVSDAPRRVNLHVNMQSTTNFHSNLLEFDIPEPGKWYTISMTTHDFEARPGDRVFVQLAMMDWGLGKYAVDIDRFSVDVVDVASAPPDVGGGVPYHPPLPPPETLRESVRVAHDSTIDRQYPEINFNAWTIGGGKDAASVLAVGGTQNAILRWDLNAYPGRTVRGGGVLEITTHALERPGVAIKDFGQVRVVEILAGDPKWDQATVTLDNLCAGEPLDRVFNTQMIIDTEINPQPGGRTRINISKAVLQRMIDGRTRGLMLLPLGAIHATFAPLEHGHGKDAATLNFNLEP